MCESESMVPSEKMIIEEFVWRYGLVGNLTQPLDGGLRSWLDCLARGQRKMNGNSTLQEAHLGEKPAKQSQLSAISSQRVFYNSIRIELNYFQIRSYEDV